ncbi:MAG: beta-galactosidase trimerization domain-containing protein [Candidatus Latescibacter sp.]|nr:beta-galactosidase trimerization domain-containing protein [Candidatus Latescibacter sp.]
MKSHSLKQRKRLAKWMVSAILLIVISVSTAPAQDDQLAITRANPEYKNVLTVSKIDRKVLSWYNGYSTRAKGYTDETWAEELRHIMAESAAAGIDGPFTPNAARILGQSRVDDMNKSFGMKFPYMAHAGNYSPQAKQAGAKFLFGMKYVSGEYGRVACWDPRYREFANAAIEKWLRENGKSPWLSCVLGMDEPLNYAGTSRTPGAVEIVNKALKEKYGVTIALTPIDSSKAYYEWPVEPAILNKPAHDVALLRVAMWRWLNEQLYMSAKREYDLVRRYAPGVEYHAYNRNAINIFDFISTDVRNSLDRLDQSCIYDVTDCYSADPYPTGNLQRDGRDRALYHVGFIAKFITDLAAGKPSKIIMQAFKFTGLYPTPGNLREWTSQAAKAGVTHLEWYGWPRVDNPDLYREMLRMSRLWKDMPALDIPKTADIAVLFSDDSRNAVNDAGMNSYYSLHVILGENLGAWYAFTGENHVRKGRQSLDAAKLIIAPELSYVSRDFAQKLTDRVKNGATLVLLDPDALNWDIETGSLASFRKELMGAPLGASCEASQLNPTAEGKARFKGIEYLLLTRVERGVVARTLKTPADARVLFTFGDGKPAVYSRKLGNGEVIVFGGQPFGSSLQALRPFGWDKLLAALCDELDIKRNLPVWRFLLPETGGEVAVYDILVKPGK